MQIILPHTKSLNGPISTDIEQKKWIPQISLESLDEQVCLLLRYSDHPSFSLVPGATDLLPFHPIMTFYVVLTGGAGEKGATIRWNKIQTLTDL